MTVQDYLQQHNLTAEQTKDGFYFLLNQKGKGNFPKKTDSVTLTYTKESKSGNLLEEVNTPTTFALRKLDKHWISVLQKVEEGSQGQIILSDEDDIFIYKFKVHKVRTYSQAKNEETIVNYLAENHIVAKSTESGLHYVILEKGDLEAQPSVHHSVTVSYKGYSLDGKVFDKSKSPITFPLSALILGWQEGIPLIGKGGIIQLFVPAHLAYESAPPSNNGVIVFDVRLHDFQ